MAAERVIPVDPETSIKDLFELVSNEPMVVSVSGKQFRIVREKPDIWANYDPERARAGLESIVGMLAGSDIDFEAWKQEIREQRGQYSIGRPYDKE